MAKFKVIGAHAVGGVEPGGTVELDLPDENIAALIRGGNIEPVALPLKAAVAAVEVRPRKGGE